MGAVRLSHAARACRTAPSPVPVFGVMSQLYHIYWLIPICWRGISLIIPLNHRVPWATWNTPLCWVITKAHSASKEYLYLLATSNYFAFYHWTCRESKYNACTVWGFTITLCPQLSDSQSLRVRVGGHRKRKVCFLTLLAQYQWGVFSQELSNGMM